MASIFGIAKKGLGLLGKKKKKTDLKKIHDKYFDKSGEMKQKGKDIVKEGLKGLGKQKDPWQQEIKQNLKTTGLQN